MDLRLLSGWIYVYFRGCAELQVTILPRFLSTGGFVINILRFEYWKYVFITDTETKYDTPMTALFRCNHIIADLQGVGQALVHYEYESYYLAIL